MYFFRNKSKKHHWIGKLMKQNRFVRTAPGILILLNLLRLRTFWAVLLQKSKTLAMRDRVKFSYTFIGRGGEEEGGVEVLIVFILYSEKTTSWQSWCILHLFRSLFMFHNWPYTVHWDAALIWLSHQSQTGFKWFGWKGPISESFRWRC